MITSSCQKLCYGNWELLQVLVIPWTGLWWAKWSWNSCLLLSFFDTQGQPVILLSLVLGVHSYLQCIQKKDLGKQVSEPNEVFCVTVCIHFFCVSMFVYKRWMYLKMTTGLKIIPSVYIYLCQQVCSQNVVSQRKV